MNTLLDRIKMIIEAKELSPRSFAIAIKFNYSTLNNYLTGRRSTIDSELIGKIAMSFDDISTKWLLTGKGEMLKKGASISSANQGNGNSIEYNHVGVGNTVNVSLPSSGTQKIINPDGSVEVLNTDSGAIPTTEDIQDINQLKAEISYLRDTMKVKDDLIASQKETIELLKHRLSC